MAGVRYENSCNSISNIIRHVSIATDHCRAWQQQLWAPACWRLCRAAPAGAVGADGAAAVAAGGGDAPQLWLGVERSTGHPPCIPAASAT